MFALLPLAALALVAWLAMVMSVDDPRWLVPSRAWESPSREHWLGCGDGGIDLVSAIASATVRALAMGAQVAALGFTVGTPLGTWAAYRGGAFERLVARVCDLVQAFPTFLFAMSVLAAVRVPSRVHIAFVFSVTAWVPFARLALAEARVLRRASYIEAAEALGASKARVLFRHLIPGVLAPASVQFGSSAAAVVIGEAALSFIGLGPRDGLSLGALLEQGLFAMTRAPHVLASAVFVLIAINVALLSSGKPFNRVRQSTQSG
jgi:ABC-type dipeptide/oligopeptide/nickel transport system permease subunit